jgi:hypothetical protein
VASLVKDGSSATVCPGCGDEHAIMGEESDVDLFEESGIPIAGVDIARINEFLSGKPDTL